MVKINKTLGLALLTALAASCSSDNDVAQSNPTVENNNGVAYATLRIDLPTQQGSRAVSSFEDGLDAEYHVNDATLLVFKKANSTDAEGDYTFVEKVPLTLPTSWTPQKDNGITTTGTIVAKLTKSSLADARQGNYYGLVILNNKDNNDKDKVTLPGENATTTYSTFNGAINTDAAKMQEKAFFMANAPEWTANDAEPLTLVHFDGSKIYTTQDQASKGGAAATFHVERGLAKVTIDETSKTASISGSAHSGDGVSISGWQLDVTNKSTFPIHNVYGLKGSYPDIWKEDASATLVPTFNRFHDMTNSFKRVYWGIDPNYDGDTRNQKGDAALNACKEAFNIATNGDNIKTTFGKDNPQYCLENTFDIDNMTQGQTTRVLFQATYTPSGMNAGDTFFKVGTKMYTQENLETLINNIAKTVDANYATDYTLNLGTIASTAGEVPLTKENFTAKEGVTPNVKAEDLAAKVNELLNSKIATYYKGVCYYIGRIQHFGDETPWNPGESYGTDNQKYLGRYGVLRNNWYDLKVNSVTGPGEPTPPEVIPENPDDENNVYVNMTVKILQWAKHSTQNLDI